MITLSYYGVTGKNLTSLLYIRLMPETAVFVKRKTRVTTQVKKEATLTSVGVAGNLPEVTLSSN